MKKNAENPAETIVRLFGRLEIEDKVKVIDSLAGPLRRRIDRVIRDTYDPGFGGCSEFFIEDFCVYWNGPKDYKTEKCVTACSCGQDNISFPLR